MSGLETQNREVLVLHEAKAVPNHTTVVLQAHGTEPGKVPENGRCGPPNKNRNREKKRPVQMDLGLKLKRARQDVGRSWQLLLEHKQ